MDVNISKLKLIELMAFAKNFPKNDSTPVMNIDIYLNWTFQPKL